MIMVNIADAKAKLSELIEAVNNGEDVVICKHNRPVAELRAVPLARTAPRDLTPMFPDWKIDPAFFEPMTEDELALWEGGDPSTAGRVAEAPPPYGSKDKPRRKRR
jgi:antitoxin (DNA-binding transcriptional repressor) of toxin-antitoxin stability system